MAKNARSRLQAQRDSERAPALRQSDRAVIAQDDDAGGDAHFRTGMSGAFGRGMNIRRFRRLFRVVLLSTAPASLLACASRTEMPEEAACIDLTAADRYTRLTLGPDVDGIAFATRGGVDSATQLSPVHAGRLASLGTPCARAKDRSACEAAIDRLLDDPSIPSWNLRVSDSYLPELVTDVAVITAGDDIRGATLADVLAAAAPIETRDEAAAALLLQNGAVDCGGHNVRPEAGGWTFKRTRKYCDGQETEYFTHIDRDAKMTAAGTHTVHEGDDGCIEGRRPANLVPTEQRWLSSLATCFSEIAHMEAAAVLAFDDLHRALTRLGAPTGLLARVRHARADEVEHAAVTARLASRFGGRPLVPRVDARSVTDDGRRANAARDLASPRLAHVLTLALENAVEGCVREAFGALVAAHQAAHAADPAVRAAFTNIAIDEARHVELSLSLDAWLQEQLTESDRALVEGAKDQAFRELEVTCTAIPTPDVVHVAGMPTPQAALALLRQLRWAALQNAA